MILVISAAGNFPGANMLQNSIHHLRYNRQRSEVLGSQCFFVLQIYGFFDIVILLLQCVQLDYVFIGVSTIFAGKVGQGSRYIVAIRAGVSW